MSLSLKRTLSSDAMHNHNCYNYLLQLKTAINEEVIALFPKFIQLPALLIKEYNETLPYGDLYSIVIAAIEELVEKKTSIIGSSRALPR